MSILSQSDIFVAQYGEDVVLASIFNKRRGVCVEVGGFDGITGSNTYFFEKLGWDCLIVEPVPSFCDQIRQVRNCKIVEAAASDGKGEIEFHIVEGAGTLSSSEITDAHLKRIHEEGGVLNRILVPRLPLTDILEAAAIGEIDFISIDVEGHELSVLRGFDLDRFRPRILIVEDNWSEVDSSVRDYLAGHNYIRFKRTGCNDWFARQGDPLLRKSAILKVGLTGVARRAKGHAKTILPDSVVGMLRRLRHAGSR